jgi:hypothetical protein
MSYDHTRLSSIGNGTWRWPSYQRALDQSQQEQSVWDARYRCYIRQGGWTLRRGAGGWWFGGHRQRCRKKVRPCEAGCAHRSREWRDLHALTMHGQDPTSSGYVLGVLLVPEGRPDRSPARSAGIGDAMSALSRGALAEPSVVPTGLSAS